MHLDLTGMSSFHLLLSMSYSSVYSIETVLANEEATQQVEQLVEFTKGAGLDSHQLFINGLIGDSKKDTLEAISDAMYEQTPFLQVSFFLS